MVDAAEIFDARATDSTARLPVTGRVLPFDAETRGAYSRFCSDKLHSTPQKPAFVEAWADDGGSELIVVELVRSGDPLMMLVLEVVKEGVTTIARFPGGRHANGSFVPSHEESAGIGDILRETITQARPDIDLVLLERNEPARRGLANPLRTESCQQSPNVALAVDLAGGFDAVLERNSGKRKRKKYRSQTRKFEAAGGHRRFAASTPQDVDRLLSAFYEMKAARFRQMGVTDVFAPDTVKRSFRHMFAGALGSAKPEFVLHGLEVGGVLRAITGSSISGDRLTCEFSAFADDELSGASPGDFLFFENIREACEMGLDIYDFGVGDELYKRQWCDIETKHFDFHLPLTSRGYAVSAIGRMSGAVKRTIKENQLVWSLLKRARRSRSGGSAADDSSG
ncbi:GNAT family N-acetyltransferase [Mesorhizobium sp. Z1-4]|uniref:GNAT family N-acetyltransferase n=1 Tax=Mesorhizobium sp. Z1-4 TaxID=2448478 RepID=UPI000FDCBCB3|nr:GNAT family N-acetyltransferase [Mesorhizobium sp. Z1-4]